MISNSINKNNEFMQMAKMCIGNICDDELLLILQNLVIERRLELSRPRTRSYSKRDDQKCE